MVTVSYQVIIGTDKSSASPPVVFMCAGRPKDVLGLTVSQDGNRVMVGWGNQDQGSVGTQLTSISISRFTDTWSLLAQLPATSTSYTDIIQPAVSYTYKVTTINWVGDSPSPPTALITTARFADPGMTFITNALTGKTLQKYDVTVVARDVNGVIIEHPIELMFLIIRDYCIPPTGNYECVRVGTTNQYYQPDVIGPAGVYIQLQNSGSSYAGSYYPTYVGFYAAGIEMYNSGGVWCELWENVFLYGVPDQSFVQSNLTRHWAQYELITTYASTYVSMKLSGLIKSPVTERVTIFVIADEGVRVYWGGGVVIDAWGTCCHEASFTALLEQGQFYPFKVEWKQYEGVASYSIKWESISIPKQVIPPQYLYYPTKVKSWLLTVTLGLSSASLCYASNFPPTPAGSSVRISLYSVDSKSALVDNPTDQFSLTFTYASISLNVNSLYDSGGKSHADITFITAGTYAVAVTLYGIAVKGSPYSLTVTALAAVETNSVSGLAGFVAGRGGTVVCGVMYSFGVTLFDQYMNPASSSPIDMQIVFKDSNSYISPIGVSPPADWEAVYGKDYLGTSDSQGKVSFSIFRAGTYQAVVRLNGVALTEGPSQISAVPSKIYAPRCVAVWSSLTVTAGVAYVFEVQARDEYFNVSKDPLSTLSSVVCTAKMGTSVVQAAASDVQPGVFAFNMMLATAGKYMIEVLLNSTPISNSGFQVTVLSANLSPQKSTLSQVPAKIQAGTIVPLTLTVKDEFSNAYIGEMQKLNVTVLGNYTGLLPAQSLNNYNGTFTISFQVQRVDNYTLYCSINDVYISGNYQLFTVTQGIVAAAKTVVSISSPYKVATGRIYIYSSDAFGNSIQNPVHNPLMGFARYKAFLYGPASYEIVGTFDDFTNYIFDLTPVKAAGDYSLIVGLEQQGGLLAFYFSSQDFTGLVASLDYRNAPTAAVQTYSSLDPVIAFNWGNTGPSQLSVSDNFAVRWVGFVLAPHSEVLSLIVTVDELARLSWNGVVLFDTVTTGVGIPVLRADVSVSRNTLYPLTLDFVELSGPASIKLEWLSPLISRQVIPSSNLFSRLNAESGPLKLSTYSDSIDPGRYSFSKIDADPFALHNAGQGNRKSFLLTTYDQFHNQLGTSASLTGTFVTSPEVAVAFKEVNPGLQTVSFTLTSLGSLRLNIFTTISSISRLVCVFDVTVVQGMGTALKSEVSGVVDVVAGDMGSMILTSKDYQGNILVNGGDNVSVTITDSDGPAVVEDQSLVDNKDGTYTLMYRIKKSGTYTASFTLNGDSTLQVTQLFTILPGPPTVDQSYLTIPSSIKLNQDLTVTIQLNDQYGNPATAQPLMYVYLRHKINESFAKLQFVLTPKDATKGVYTGTVNYNRKDAISSGCTDKDVDVITRCTLTGPLLVEAWMMLPGLSASFYSSLNLAGLVSLQRIDLLPVLDWVNSPISSLNPNLLSVFWMGHILPAVNGTYTFSLLTNQFCDLKMIHQVPIVSATPGPADGTVALSAGKFTDFNITYNTQDSMSGGTATGIVPELTVNWALPGSTNSVAVPGSVLFYRQVPEIGGAAYPLDGLNA